MHEVQSCASTKCLEAGRLRMYHLPNENPTVLGRLSAEYRRLAGERRVRKFIFHLSTARHVVCCVCYRRSRNLDGSRHPFAHHCRPADPFSEGIRILRSVVCIELLFVENAMLMIVSLCSLISPPWAHRPLTMWNWPFTTRWTN